MFRAPYGAGLPAFSTILNDLPADTRQIARHLGIKESTLKTYKRRDQAPTTVMLALFWETRWGRSVADTEAANFAAIHYRSAMIANQECERLRAMIDRLELEISNAYIQGRAANSPIYLTK